MKAVVLAILSILAGCTTYSELVTSKNKDCGYIGCETGGLVIYPHEENAAIELPRRWYGIDGELPSDYPPDSPERKELRALQIEKLRSMVLDPFGRPMQLPR